MMMNGSFLFTIHIRPDIVRVSSNSSAAGMKSYLIRPVGDDHADYETQCLGI